MNFIIISTKLFSHSFVAAFDVVEHQGPLLQ